MRIFGVNMMKEMMMVMKVDCVYFGLDLISRAKILSWYNSVAKGVV